MQESPKVVDIGVCKVSEAEAYLKSCDEGNRAVSLILRGDLGCILLVLRTSPPTLVLLALFVFTILFRFLKENGNHPEVGHHLLVCQRRGLRAAMFTPTPFTPILLPLA